MNWEIGVDVYTLSILCINLHYFNWWYISKRWARLAQARAASRPGLCAIAPGRRAGAPPLWQLARSFPVTGPQPLSSLRRAGNRASRPGHRALARSSLLRDWFPCAGAVLSLAQTHRGRPQTTSTRLYAGGEPLDKTYHKTGLPRWG